MNIEIPISGQAAISTEIRFYTPKDVARMTGWSEKTAIRGANKAACEFELKCKNGEVLNREQEREKEKAAQVEAAKLKTVRQYAESVYMPTKEATFSKTSLARKG